MGVCVCVCVCGGACLAELPEGVVAQAALAAVRRHKRLPEHPEPRSGERARKCLLLLNAERYGRSAPDAVAARETGRPMRGAA